jgi:3-oxoacyl-[acyl-carrier protein] reductase
MRLANKVAVITGASSGIGRSIAYLFAKEGAKIVAAADINIAGGEETVAAIKKNGGEAIFIRADVTVASEVEHLVKAGKDKFGRIDILLNCAGIWGAQGENPIENIDQSLWDRVYAVNVRSIFFTTKYAVPEIRKAGGGVIVNVASMAGLRPIGPRNALYASSKGAIITLTKALAVELASDKIRVNCVNPFITETSMLKDIQLTDETLRAVASTVPLGRVVKPEDVAYAALYLASDESSMLTGACINVDGGTGV